MDGHRVEVRLGSQNPAYRPPHHHSSVASQTAPDVELSGPVCPEPRWGTGRLVQWPVEYLIAVVLATIAIVVLLYDLWIRP